MPKGKAQAKYIRMTPRKIERVLDMVRGKRVDGALTMLSFSTLRAARPVAKVIKSAAANSGVLDSMHDAYIAEAYVGSAPGLKRVMPRAMGRADVFTKRSSHITVVVDRVPQGR